MRPASARPPSSRSSSTAGPTTVGCGAPATAPSRRSRSRRCWTWRTSSVASWPTLCRSEEPPRGTVFRLLRDELTASDGLTVLVFEDVHWADEASLDLIQFLSRRVRDCRLLILTTYRDDALGARPPAAHAARRGRHASMGAAALTATAVAGCGRDAGAGTRRRRQDPCTSSRAATRSTSARRWRPPATSC